MSENYCIVCGDIVPEGQWVCYKCFLDNGIKEYRVEEWAVDAKPHEENDDKKEDQITEDKKEI